MIDERLYTALIVVGVLMLLLVAAGRLMWKLHEGRSAPPDEVTRPPGPETEGELAVSIVHRLVKNRIVAPTQVGEATRLVALELELGRALGIY